MTTEGHIAALQRRHIELETQIEKELQQPMADSLVLRDLKRKKLDIKDELARLTSMHAA